MIDFDVINTFYFRLLLEIIVYLKILFIVT